MKCTLPHITFLAQNEVFVFGSNLLGRHAGGAAKQAVKSFGAINNQAEGLQGQSYAIPTMEAPGGRVLTVQEIEPYVDRFIQFALANPDLEFLVTEIGCGIAGRTPEEIAPLFNRALYFSNVSLPKRFLEVLSEETHAKPIFLGNDIAELECPFCHIGLAVFPIYIDDYELLEEDRREYEHERYCHYEEEAAQSDCIHLLFVADSEEFIYITDQDLGALVPDDVNFFDHPYDSIQEYITSLNHPDFIKYSWYDETEATWYYAGFGSAALLANEPRVE